MLDSVQVSQATNTAAMQATGLVAGLAKAGLFDSPQAALSAWEGAFGFLQPVILAAHDANQNLSKSQQGFAAQGIEATVVAEAHGAVQAPQAPQDNVVPFQPAQAPVAAPTAIPGAQDGWPDVVAKWQDYNQTPDNWLVKTTQAGKTFLQHKWQNDTPNKEGKVYKQSLWLDSKGNPSWAAALIQQRGLA